MKNVAIFTFCLGALVISCGQQEKKHEIPQQHLQSYRFYYDKFTNDKKPIVEVRTFSGEIRIADVKGMFGDPSGWAKSDSGNYLSGWRLRGNSLWSAVVGPSLKSVNVISFEPGGTISSVIDLNGDSVADVVDIRLENDRRLTLINQHGATVLEQWLLGRNPLCDGKVLASMSLEPFGCDNDTGGSGSGVAGSTAADYSSLRDPFAGFCAHFRGSGAAIFSGGVMAHGGHGYGHLGRGTDVFSSWREEGEGPRHGAIVSTSVYRDDSGNHVATYREYQFWDEGEKVRTIAERVDHEGQGTRTITDHGADGTTKTRTEAFETEVDEDGHYGPESPREHEDAPDSVRIGSDTPTGPDTDSQRGAAGASGPGAMPGPEGGDGMRKWCEARERAASYRSGVEIAVDEGRKQLFKDLDCDDLVRSGDHPSRCPIFSWAQMKDFNQLFAPPPPAGGCGPYEQPGPDGTCGPVSKAMKLMGETAWIAAAKLQDRVICDPVVCNPAPDMANMSTESR